MHSRYAIALLLVSSNFMLAACGGGSHNSSPPEAPPMPVTLVPGTQVPANATTDSSAATDFVSQVVAKGEANSDDPLAVGDATLATSESADPVTII